MSDRDRPQPNILFVVSDEERRNTWLDGRVDMPAHERLRRDGLSFDRYYTHSSPCSPSRASLYTGRYLAEHGVVDNVSFPAHTELDPAIPTIGSLLQDVGYTSGYLGKWHLNNTPTPPMADYGYDDWQGNDHHYTGTAWTGRFFDPDIVGQADRWLRDHAGDAQPWVLTVALVGPHDIMWYPADQPDYAAAHPDDAATLDFIRKYRLGDDVPVEPPPTDYPERFDQLPANFDDDLHTKPDIQRAWRTVRNHEHFVGTMPRDDTRLWLRQLDYYAWLHEDLDRHVVDLLATVDELGLYDDTMIVYTSDHGDACGAHGLRAKLPCVYEEVMGVPLVIKPPATSSPVAGKTTQALATHVDLATTIVNAGGGDTSGMSGVDLAPVLDDPESSVRDFVFFSQDSAQSELLRQSRYAVRGFFDGSTKYARYYGIGGGIQRNGERAETPKTFDVDADFDDQDHEWYELEEDPFELVNLANDRDRRDELRVLFDDLLGHETTELSRCGQATEGGIGR